jgi:hypothetical protein
MKPSRKAFRACSLEGGKEQKPTGNREAESDSYSCLRRSTSTCASSTRGRSPGRALRLEASVDQPESPAGWLRGRNPTVPISDLSEAWVRDTCVVYIGKATSLRTRLRAYLAHGSGRRSSHWSGTPFHTQRRRHRHPASTTALNTGSLLTDRPIRLHCVVQLFIVSLSK